MLCFDNFTDKIDSSVVFLQRFDTEYPIDETEIISKDCDLTQNQLGVLYRNIIKWLQSIQNAKENKTLDDEYKFHLKMKKA